MIGYLKGTVIDRGMDRVLLNVGGVGYVVFTSELGSKPSFAEASAGKNKELSEIELWIHTHVREDQISLFGFGDKRQLRLFELLLSVSGVGPKIAMMIVGTARPDRVEKAISDADVGFFTGVKGLGKKGAQRIIIELKNKIGSVAELDLSGDEGGDEVMQGLVGMGFEVNKVREVLRGIGNDVGEGERLKRAIKELSNK